MGCHALLQGIFLTQGSNLDLLSLLHWQILYHCATWETNTYPFSFQRLHRFTAHTPNSRAQANIWSEQRRDLPPSAGKPHILTSLLSPSLGTSVFQALFVACVCVCVSVKDTEEMGVEIKVWEKEFIIIFLWFPVTISSATVVSKTQQHCGKKGCVHLWGILYQMNKTWEQCAAFKYNLSLLHTTHKLDA